MKEIDVRKVTQVVSELFQDACHYLPEDVVVAIKKAQQIEESPIGQEVLESILENAEISEKEQIPLCQDTGDAVLFLELGQDVHLELGCLRLSLRLGFGFCRAVILFGHLSSPDRNLLWSEP